MIAPTMMQLLSLAEAYADSPFREMIYTRICREVSWLDLTDEERDALREKIREMMGVRE